MCMDHGPRTTDRGRTKDNMDGPRTKYQGPRTDPSRVVYRINARTNATAASMNATTLMVAMMGKAIAGSRP
jgi:hypothetical protein